MLNKRVLSIMGVLALINLLLLAPVLLWEFLGIGILPVSLIEGLYDSPLSWSWKVPAVLVMILGHLGVPALLDPESSSWGYSEPTIAGFILAFLFWIAGLWLLARLLSALLPGK